MSLRNFSTFNPLFSHAANTAIRNFDPDGRPSGRATFPSRHTWEQVTFRVQSNETVRDWFKQAIGPEETADSRINDCAIEDYFALFGGIAWDNDGIHFCGLQALVTTGGNLLDYYSGNEGTRASYYRLDVDLRMPGPVFKEPMPHVHCVPDGAPRFAFVCRTDEFLPIAFIEFIYLNHFHDKWIKWARSELSKRGGSLPFESIVDAFNSGSIVPQIEQFKPHLVELKRVLSSAKRERVPNALALNASMAYLNYLT